MFYRLHYISYFNISLCHKTQTKIICWTANSIIVIIVIHLLYYIPCCQYFPITDVLLQQLGRGQWPMWMPVGVSVTLHLNILCTMRFTILIKWINWTTVTTIPLILYIEFVSLIAYWPGSLYWSIIIWLRKCINWYFKLRIYKFYSIRLHSSFSVLLNNYIYFLPECLTVFSQ